MADRSISQLVADIKADSQALVKEETALAKSEISAGAKKIALGIALAAIGALFLFLALFMGLFSAAAGFHEGLGLSWWLSFILVFGILVIISLVLVAIAIPIVKGAQLAPTSAIDGAKSAVQALTRTVRNPSRTRL